MSSWKNWLGKHSLEIPILVFAFVMGKGHRVQHYRIMESLIRTDPAGMMDRWAQTVRRRKYQVHSPLSLWHIDGNHKLIRYNI